jgi:hypothetical protein
MNEAQKPEHSQIPGLFFSLDELKTLFSAMKIHEEVLPPDAESLLFKIERILYDHLTIREIELLSETGSTLHKLG